MKTWIDPFLASLALTGNVSEAARRAGITSSTAYALRLSDADFAAAWEGAVDERTDFEEAELTRRAMGYDAPVIYQGQPQPFWVRDEYGRIVQARVENDDGSVAYAPVQARDADGQLRWVTERKASDALLLAKVKAYRKGRYAERTEHTGRDGEPLVMDDAARAARIAALMQAAQSRVPTVRGQDGPPGAVKTKVEGNLP